MRQSSQPADAAQIPGADLLREWRDNKHTLKPRDTSIRTPLAQDWSFQIRPVSTTAADIKARLDALLSQSTSPGTLSAPSTAVPAAHSQVARNPACEQPGLPYSLSAPVAHQQKEACTPDSTHVFHRSVAKFDSTSPAASQPLPQSRDSQGSHSSSLQPTLVDGTSAPCAPQGVAEPAHEVSHENPLPCSTTQGNACATPTIQAEGSSRAEDTPAERTAEPSGQPGTAHHPSEFDAEGQRSTGPDNDSCDKATACLSPDNDALQPSGPSTAVETASNSPVCSQASSHLSDTMEHILDGMFQSDSNHSSPCQSPPATVLEAGPKPLSPPAPTDSPQLSKRSRVDRIMSCARSEVIDSVSSCNEDSPCKPQNCYSPCWRDSAKSDRLCTSRGSGTQPTCRPHDDSNPCSAFACDVTFEEAYDGHSIASAAAASIAAAAALRSPGAATGSRSPSDVEDSPVPLRYQSHCESGASHGIAADDDIAPMLPFAPHAPSLDTSVLLCSCDDVCEGVVVATNGGRSHATSPCTLSPPSLPPPDDIVHTPTTTFSQEHSTAARRGSSADRYDAVDMGGGQLHTCSVHLVDSELDRFYGKQQQAPHQLPPWVEDEALDSPVATGQAPTSHGNTALTALNDQKGCKMHGVSAGRCPWDDGQCFSSLDGISVVRNNASSDVLHEHRIQNNDVGQGVSSGAASHALVATVGSIPAKHALLSAPNRLVDGSGHGDSPQGDKDVHFHPAREQAHPVVENIASLEDWLQRKGRLARWVGGDPTPVQGACNDGCVGHWPVGDASLHGLLVQDTQVFGPATVGDAHVQRCWQSIHRVSHDLRDSS